MTDYRNGVSRNAVEAGLAHAECARAQDEFARELPTFCRRIGISPALLNLPTPTLLMLVCMRLAAENDVLAARVDALSLPASAT